ncbi:MAG: LacI family DNA-binding transcriptional regulator [Spirochaetia bacterium]|nr:LacI family DNA-binding transcriptional regulator [Spirochaetia bacterium]
MKKKGRERLASLKTIAQKAGVSIVSASVALHPSSQSSAKVSEATRKKILRIAARYHYKPNIYASGLRRSRVGRIGFASDRFNDLSNNEIKHSLIRAGTLRGIPLHFLNYDQFTPAADMVSDMLSHDFERLVVFRFWDRMTPGERRALDERFKERLLVIDYFNERDLSDYGVSFLHTQKGAAFHELFRLMVSSGHRRIAGLSFQIPPQAPDLGTFNDLRMPLFKSISRSVGKEVFDDRTDLFTTDLSSPEAVYETAREIVRRGYDAISLHHDQIAPFVYKAVHDEGRRIPQDVGVAGYDDLAFSKYLLPPLTTVRVDSNAYAQGILDWLEGPRAPRQVVLPFQVVKRESLLPSRETAD